MSDVLPPADLLSHAGFVRSLARGLLGDDAAADDAAQDALVRALERPPRARGALRSWLAVVVRRTASNARRADARRRRREESAARPEGLPSAADLAARAEVLQAVGAAVRALEPTERRLVLLRHYEGLPPREIAARLDVPVDRVRAGLARAHARRRARLLAASHGDASRWRSSLAALVGLEPAARTGAPVPAGIAVATATKAAIGIAAGACVVAVVAWGASLLGTPPVTPPPAGAATETARADPAAPPRLAANPAPAAGPKEARPAPSPLADVPAGWERRSIGRIALVVPQGWLEAPGPSPGSAIWSRPDEPGRKGIAFGVLPKDFPAGKDSIPSATREVAVDGHGARREEFTNKDYVGVRVTPTADDASLPAVVFALMGPKATWDADRDVLERILDSVRIVPAPALVGPGSPTEEPSVAYLDALTGSVLGPVVEAVVLRGSRPTAGVPLRLLVDERDATNVVRSGATDANGSIHWDDVPTGAYVLDVGTGTDTGVRVHFGVVPYKPRPRVVVVLGTAAIEGFAYDRLGHPAAGRRVDAWAYHTPRRDAYGAVVRADGSYRIDSLPAGHWAVGMVLPTGREFLADTRNASADLRWGETKRLDLGTPVPEPTVRGRVRSAGGTALAGPSVYLMFERLGVGESLFAALDDAGRFERRVPPGDYLLKVSGLVLGGLGEARTTVATKDVETDLVVPGSTVRGSVRDPVAADASGAWRAVVLLEPVAGGDPAMVPAATDGAFAAHGVPAGAYRVHAEFGPPNALRASESQRVEVVEGRDVTDLRFDLPAK